MTIREYINKKQKLLENAGATQLLVPEEQIVEVKQIKLEIHEDTIGVIDSDICPYCLVYLNNPVRCDGCPMYIAGNGCDEYDSSYFVVTDQIEDKKIINIPGMVELAKQYNEELKNERD